MTDKDNYWVQPSFSVKVVQDDGAGYVVLQFEHNDAEFSVEIGRDDAFRLARMLAGASGQKGI